MTRRQASDYESVFRFVVDLVKTSIPGDTTGPKVKEITSDFEWPLWLGIKKVFPDVAHHGCSFHWSQCILRKVGNLGLIDDYKRPGIARDNIVKLMALCYLPENKIGEVFSFLKSKAPKRLSALFNYISRNWIYGNRWPPKNWSVFYRAIRTNNDAEELHFIWNDMAGRKMKFYRLADFLEELSAVVGIEIRLLTQAKICREIRKNSKLKNSVLFDLWDRYLANELTTYKLLESILKDMQCTFPSGDTPLNDVFVEDPGDRYDMTCVEDFV